MGEWSATDTAKRVELHLEGAAASPALAFATQLTAVEPQRATTILTCALPAGGRVPHADALLRLSLDHPVRGRLVHPSGIYLLEGAVAGLDLGAEPSLRVRLRALAQVQRRRAVRVPQPAAAELAPVGAGPGTPRVAAELANLSRGGAALWVAAAEAAALAREGTSVDLRLALPGGDGTVRVLGHTVYRLPAGASGPGAVPADGRVLVGMAFAGLDPETERRIDRLVFERQRGLLRTGPRVS